MTLFKDYCFFRQNKNPLFSTLQKLYVKYRLFLAKVSKQEYCGTKKNNGRQNPFNDSQEKNIKGVIFEERRFVSPVGNYKFSSRS